MPSPLPSRVWMKRRSSFRPALEYLEDRLAPAAQIIAGPEGVDVTGHAWRLADGVLRRLDDDGIWHDKVLSATAFGVDKTGHAWHLAAGVLRRLDDDGIWHDKILGATALGVDYTGH